MNGTIVTWINKDTTIHTVGEGNSGNVTAPSLDSGCYS
jgi:hypothetical protein